MSTFYFFLKSDKICLTFFTRYKKMPNFSFWIYRELFCRKRNHLAKTAPPAAVPVGYRPLKYGSTISDCFRGKSARMLTEIGIYEHE